MPDDSQNRFRFTNRTLDTDKRELRIGDSQSVPDAARPRLEIES